MKRQKNEMERREKESKREEKAVPLMFFAATLKVNSKSLLKMHDMHTTRKYVMDFKK